MRWMFLVLFLLLAFAFIVPSAVAAPCATTGGSTALESAALGLGAGEWCELQTQNFTASLLQSAATTIFHYADSASWDSVSRAVYFFGSGHCTSNCGGIPAFIMYDEATNTWSEGEDPTGGDNYIHAYDHNTADPAAGEVFYRPYNSRTVHVYDTSAETWDVLPAIPSAVVPTTAITYGVEYFPELNALVNTDKNGHSYWDRASNTWQALSGGLTDLGNYHNWIEYDGVNSVVLYGGGNGASAVYQIEADRTITRLADSPAPMTCKKDGTATEMTHISSDPAGGGLVVYFRDLGAWRHFDPVTNTWSPITHSMPPISYLTVETAIADYGVILYADYAGGNPKVYLYKHAPSAPTVCGDGVAGVGEVCDGSDLNGETCSSQGFSGGTLSCNGGCDGFITTACTSSDATPPVRSNGQPSGSLPSGTTSTTISLDTDEASTCKYGTSPGVAYASLPNTFSTTGGTAHSSAVSGLSDGNSYSYYVRCLDGSGNANPDDYLIRFAVASPPSGSVASFTVQETAGVGASVWPVTVVVPLGEGDFVSTAAWRLMDDGAGQPLPAQFDPLELWLDGSLRHVSVKFLVTLASGEKRSFSIETGGGGPLPVQPVMIQDSAGLYTVTTGPLKFTVNKNSFSILETVWRDANGDGLFVDAERVILPGATHGGRFDGCTGVSGGSCISQSQPDTSLGAPVFTVEESGPVRAVIRASVPAAFNDINGDGDVDDPGEYHRHGYAVRLYAYAGSGDVKVEYQLQNGASGPGLTGGKYAAPLYFNSLSLDWLLQLGTSTVRAGRHDGTVDSSSLTASGRELAATLHDKYLIRNADGTSPSTDCSDNCYPLGFLDVSDGANGVTAYIRHFWETFPKGLEVGGDKRLSVQLFPDWAGNWDYGALNYEPLYWLDDMRQVYEEVLLSFHDGTVADDALMAKAETLRFHPVPSLSPSHYRQTSATFELDGLFPFDTYRGGSGLLTLDYTGQSESAGDGYVMGWDRFLVDSVYRLHNPCGTGGGPTSGQFFAVTGSPDDYWRLDLYAKGELNARPSWLGDDYTFEDDWSRVRLDEAYCTATWRDQGDPMRYPITGSARGNLPRDDQHAWHHHVGESFWFTGNYWVRDWYRFLGEFREQRLTGADAGAGNAQRAIGHAVQDAYWAARITGDGVLRDEIADYAALRFGEVDPECGRVDFTASGTSGLEIGFHNQAFQSSLSWFRFSDWGRWARLFQYVASQIYYAEWYDRFGYHIGTGGGCVVNAGGSSGTACQMVDAMSHWYFLTGDASAWAAVSDYADDGAAGGNPPYDSCGWRRANPGNAWEGNLEGRTHKWLDVFGRADTVPPAPPASVVASDNGDGSVTVSWSAVPDASYYLVVASPAQLFECVAGCDADSRSADTLNYRHWWAAESVGATAGTSAVLPTGWDPVYAAVFAFDAADTMSGMSLVATSDGSCTDGEILSSCLCGGVSYSSGYCCSGVYGSVPCAGVACQDDPLYGAACSAGSGACAVAGTFVCSDPLSTSESPFCDAVPPVEVCGNGVDDDCDGSVDEGCGVVVQLDFDHTNGLTEPGFTALPYGSHSYDAVRGYGWSGSPGSRDRALGGSLGRDMHISSGDMRFLVDVENGDYQVTVYLQDVSYPGEPFRLDAEGVTVFPSLAGGASLSAHAFNVTVADGQLTLDFVRIAHYPRVNGLLVEPLPTGATCAEQSGVVCSLPYECPAGSGLPASDSSSCCSGKCECSNTGDLNCDGTVNIFDLVRAGNPQDRPANWLDILLDVFTNFGREY